MELIFHEETYKNLLAVGFSEDEARDMATQPEGVHLSEKQFGDKLHALVAFARWDSTKEGLDYWMVKLDECLEKQ